MNVGLVNHWFPPEAAAGGVTTYNLALSKTLTELGHRVVVIASTRERCSRVEVVKGTCVVRLPYPRISPRLDRLPTFGRHMRALRTWLYARSVAESLPEIIRRYRLDILEYADIEAEAFFHRGRIPLPYVVRLHGPLFSLEPFYHGKEQPFATGVIKRMEQRAIVGAHALTSPSWHTADLIATAYGLTAARIKVIPNLYVRDDCSWSALERKEPVVLFVGRLEWRKGADTFAEAIPRILAHAPHVRFAYVAWDRPRPDGSSMKSFLTQQLGASGALANVDFLSSDGASCLYERLRPDICVVPSRFETFSYPCFEAMVHSIPVVASRAAAIPELVDDGATGILIEPGRANELAEGVLRLIMNPSLRSSMGKAGREKAQREFDPDKLAQQTIDAYEQSRQSYAEHHS